jgi:hypothetical protein
MATAADFTELLRVGIKVLQIFLGSAGRGSTTMSPLRFRSNTSSVSYQRKNWRPENQ